MSRFTRRPVTLEYEGIEIKVNRMSQLEKANHDAYVFEINKSGKEDKVKFLVEITNMTIDFCVSQVSDIKGFILDDGEELIYSELTDSDKKEFFQFYFDVAGFIYERYSRTNILTSNEKKS